MTKKEKALAVDLLFHDLRSPLRAIRCFTEKLCRFPGVADHEETRLCRDFIVAGVERMEAILTRDRTAFHVKGKQRGVLPTVDLGECLAAAFATVHPQIAQSGARIEYTRLPKVAGERCDLIRVFSNLLSNAIKYAPPGIEPHVTIQSDDRHPGVAIVTIRDNGIGFENLRGAALFSPGVRLDTEHAGQGLGLASVKAMLERCGGSVIPFSEGPGRGATFSIFLRRPAETAVTGLPMWKGAAPEGEPLLAESPRRKAKAAGGEM